MTQQVPSASPFRPFTARPLLHRVDLDPQRLSKAKELGADFDLVVKKGDEPKMVAKRAEDMLGAQPHITIECSGAESSIQTAIYVCEAF